MTRKRAAAKTPAPAEAKAAVEPATAPEPTPVAPAVEAQAAAVTTEPEAAATTEPEATTPDSDVQAQPAPDATDTGADEAASTDAASEEPQGATDPDGAALAAAQAEAVVEGTAASQQAVPPPHITEVRAEVAFGKDPEDLAGDDDADLDALVAAALAPDTSGVWATYDGERGDAVAITVIVPDPPEGYEAMVTKGTTYTLARTKPKWVAAEHAEWLKNHPAYPISIRES